VVASRLPKPKVARSSQAGAANNFNDLTSKRISERHSSGTGSATVLCSMFCVVEMGVGWAAGVLGGATVTRIGRDHLRARSSGRSAAK
jgi:hypothetical protein